MGVVLGNLRVDQVVTVLLAACTLISDADIADKLGSDGPERSGDTPTDSADGGVDGESGAETDDDTGMAADSGYDTGVDTDPGADSGTDTAEGGCPLAGSMVVGVDNGDGTATAGYEARACSRLTGIGRICTAACTEEYAQVEVYGYDGDARTLLAVPTDVEAEDTAEWWDLCGYVVAPERAVGDVVTCTAETSAGEWSLIFTII